MKYDKLSESWHHKPGGTAPLKYLHHPEDIIWGGEYSKLGVCFNKDDIISGWGSSAYLTYDSDIYYIVYGEHPFITSTSGLQNNQIAITGVKPNVTLIGSITIPEHLNGKTVVKIGNSSFCGQGQLTQINIPSGITHIGADAFKNTNNASIYLDDRLNVPTTFDKKWNISQNPVYLSEIRCLHNNKTTTPLDAVSHTDLCNECKTATNIQNHIYIYTPKPSFNPNAPKQHYADCSTCGHQEIMSCYGRYIGPDQDIYCIFCGQLMNSSRNLFTITLPDGRVYVSSEPITFELLEHLIKYLGIEYKYDDFVIATKKLQINDYINSNKNMYIIPNMDYYEEYLRRQLK